MFYVNMFNAEVFEHFASAKKCLVFGFSFHKHEKYVFAMCTVVIFFPVIILTASTCLLTATRIVK